MKSYDMIVIGSGSGGLNVAVFMHNAGFKVLMIEKDPNNVGGDCLNTGCVPSKALIHIARQVHGGREAQKYGVNLGGTIDWDSVKEYIRSKQDHIREHESVDYFRSIGMEVVVGEAELVGVKTVQVGNERYTGKKIMLATGSTPRKLDLPGIDQLEYGVEYLDSHSIWNLEKFPEKLVVIGGGPIGLELGQAMQRLGSQVTVVQRDETFLPKEDPEITPILKAQLEAEGMVFKMGANPVGVLSKDHLKIDTREGSETLEFDAVLVAIGRELRVIQGTETAGVNLDERGRLVMNEYLQTTNPDILAIGDVAGGFQFTHAAELQAQVLLKNLFSPFKKKLSWDHFSWVTYTDPEIATFGRSAKTLAEQGVSFETLEIDLTEEDRELIDENVGKLKLYVSSGNKILGGTMIGSNAGEIAQELILAMSAGLKVDDIFTKIYPYPTAARINKKVIQQKMAGKLTDRSKWFLQKLYAMFA